MEKKDKNERFLKAVDLLYQKHLVSSQKNLAEAIGVSGPALSRIKNGTKVVSDDTIRKLNAAFKNMFNMDFFRGVEGAQLTKEQTTSQIGADNLPDSRKESCIDQSSLVNALLAAKDETIASLRDQIQQQQEIIQLLKRKLSDLAVQTGYHGFSGDIKASESGPKEIGI